MVQRQCSLHSLTDGSQFTRARLSLQEPKMPASMARLNIFAKLLDRFAARSSKYARARAEHIVETAPERALALFTAAAQAEDVEAAFIVGEHYFAGKGTLRHS